MLSAWYCIWFEESIYEESIYEGSNALVDIKREDTERHAHTVDHHAARSRSTSYRPASPSVIRCCFLLCRLTDLEGKFARSVNHTVRIPVQNWQWLLKRIVVGLSWNKSLVGDLDSLNSSESECQSEDFATAQQQTTYHNTL